MNIFIDADCLAYGDLNVLFDVFDSADDFSCFGRVLPLDDKTGWFEYEHLGELRPRVTNVIGLHGASITCAGPKNAVRCLTRP